MATIVTEDTADIKSIKYRVVYNAAASKAASRDIYTGVVDIKETYNLNAIAERMVAEGCPVNIASIRLILTTFADLVAKLVAEGRAVYIPGLVRFSPAIRGTFATEEADWDNAENQIVVNASIGSRMRVAAAKSTVQRIVTIVLPTFDQVVDMATQKPNVITSEGAFLVTGERFVWDDTAEDEGFFINVGGEERKCTIHELDPDNEYVILKTSQIFEQSGQEVQLFFRTRIDGKHRQIQFPETILTAVAQ